MSEWPYIQSVAAHAGIRSITHRLAPGEAFELVDDVVAAQGEPLLGQDTIAHYRVFGLAREHGCVVALEGQAADELFAGLPSYEAVMFREWLGAGAWWRLFHEVRLRAMAQGRTRRSVLGQLRLHRRFDRGDQAQAASGWINPSPASARPIGPSRLNRFLFDLVGTNLPAVLLIGSHARRTASRTGRRSSITGSWNGYICHPVGWVRDAASGSCGTRRGTLCRP